MITMDLHVHSSFSKRPSQWILQKISGPERVSRPMQVYRRAMQKGMTHVTITDHNTIHGALSIAHLPFTFISEEITTYFPEDGCKVHVLAYRISEDQHGDIQKIRSNVYDLAAYLTRENIFHAVAHPLYAVNGRLTPSHVEKLLLLFRNFEINGSRNAHQNDSLEKILSAVTEAGIANLAEKHRIDPLFPDIWKKNLIGGSDDHSGLHVGRTFTRIPGTTDLSEAFRRMETQGAEVAGKSVTPLTLALNLYGMASGFYGRHFHVARRVQGRCRLRPLDRSRKLEPDAGFQVMSMSDPLPFPLLMSGRLRLH